MERESEWEAKEEEEVAVEVAGGLEIRQRRRGKMGRREDSSEKEEEVGNGDQRSVYFDTDQGTEFNDVTAGLKLREVDQFVAEKNLGNGKAQVRTKEFNNHENVPVEEENQKLKNVVVANGSNLRISSEENSGNGIMKYEDEIEECEQFRPVKLGKLKVAEIDVERVLEEQETHDLYCPNCNSCITKRVILRKRKRIVRESQHDLPAEKLRHVHEASSASAEMGELGHEDETVFRCLSCFSFFIPTESGFNIFRIFGKREESRNLQSSEQIPAGNMNWVSSIFRSETSKKKGTEAGLPLTSESNNIPEKQMGISSLNMQTSPATTASGAAKLGGSRIITGKNDSVSLPGESSVIGGEQMDNQAQNDNPSSMDTTISEVPLCGESYTTSNEDPSLKAKQNSPALTVSRAADLGENGTTIGKNDAGVLLTVKSDVISGEDPVLKVNQSSPSLTVSGTTKIGESKSVFNNDADPLPREPSTNGRGQMGNQAQEDMQNYPSITISEGTLGESQATTGKSDAGDGTNKPVVMVKPSFPEGISQINENIIVPMPPDAAVPSLDAGDDIIKPVGMVKPTSPIGTSQSNQNIHENGTNKPVVMVKPSFPEGISQSNINGSVPAAAVVLPLNAGDDIIKPVDMVKPTCPVGTSLSNQNIYGSVPHAAVETHIHVGGQGVVEAGRNNDWDVLKSIVYGGLIESIISLCVVSSAAGADTSTLNICALGLANLIGGLFVIAHDLSELRSKQDPEATNQRDKPAGRYWDLLGKREHFWRQALVSILSYIIFGLLPPVIYGFSFKRSDNKEYKLLAAAAASLLCVALLAIGKAHVKPQKDYIKCLLYYLGLGVSASGLSYVAGVMINRLLVELGLFDHSAAAPSPPSSVEFLGISSGIPAWASL